MPNQRPRAPNMFKDSGHPLAGRIRTGVKTTAPLERRPRISMQLPEIMVPTIEDYAKQMFSENDPVGCRVYYCETGAFNTVDELGRPISFIGGLFKTDERGVKQFLQYFVDQGKIHYLELTTEEKEHASEKLSAEHERGEGSDSRVEESNEPDEQESEHREQPTPEPDRSGTGGEDAGQQQQPLGGATVGSTSGNGNDQQEPERDTASGEPSQENTVEEASAAPELSPLERLRAKAGTS